MKSKVKRDKGEGGKGEKSPEKRGEEFASKNDRCK